MSDSYTSVFPLRRKGEVTEVLIDWICAARLQLRESFGLDFPVLRLHFDGGGEFSSNLLRAFCRAEGIRQTFTLPASPQQNGIAERRIGMVMDVARTSMIHAAAPHFLWPFAVQYAAHQINLQPRVSLPETSPTLRWTGKVGDASAFRVWGSRAFVRDLSADKLSSRAVPCLFLGFPPDAPGWHFYHPTSRRVLSSQDVTFDEEDKVGVWKNITTQQGGKLKRYSFVSSHVTSFGAKWEAIYLIKSVTYVVTHPLNNHALCRPAICTIGKYKPGC
ncbi:unnamed protein product [Closterium sp. NIES-53]